jgi:hypothetical protein
MLLMLKKKYCEYCAFPGTALNLTTPTPKPSPFFRPLSNLHVGRRNRFPRILRRVGFPHDVCGGYSESDPLRR